MGLTVAQKLSSKFYLPMRHDVVAKKQYIMSFRKKDCPGINIVNPLNTCTNINRKKTGGTFPSKLLPSVNTISRILLLWAKNKKNVLS